METHGQEAVSCQNYELHFEAKPGYLHAIVRGVSTGIKDALERWGLIAEECKQRGFCKVLIDMDIKGHISFVELHEFGEKLPRLGFSQIKVAYLERRMNKHTLNQFAETVAVNRGVDAKVFLDITEAEAWLLS